MARKLLLGCALCVLVCFAGCSGSSGPPPVAVSGTVELDGKPLNDGSISLFPESGGAPAVLPVKDGKFEGQATPGKKKVELRAFRMGQPTKMGNEVIEATKENYLAAKWNTNSKLTAEVTASGISPNKFSAKSD